MVFKRDGLKKIPDQGQEGSCTAFALCSIINGYKGKKWRDAGVEREELDGQEFFTLVNSKYPDELKGALTPTQAFVYARDEGLIKSWLTLNNDHRKASVVKRMMKQGFLFHFVFTKADRSTAMRTGVLEKSPTGGLPHSVCGAYVNDDNKIVCVNSRGPDWGKDGYFIVPDGVFDYCCSQAYLIEDTDDKGKFAQMLYKSKIRTAVNLLSENWKYADADEKEAMNFANTMLRKVCLKQDHQYNMSKEKLQRFIDKYF